ncbi:hypothetical protein [Psychrobacter sp. S1-30-MNA-CIBAN-0213]|uniref:hypothetical protein n=1 Tax=unclassified Psychrobacter TaxID=196806 RepID=UPI0033320B44
MVIQKRGLALIVADILGAAQGYRRLVRGVIAESGTTLPLATAPVPAKIVAKSRNSSPTSKTHSNPKHKKGEL